MASLPCGTLVRVSNGSFHEIQSAIPCTAGVLGNVPVEKGIKDAIKLRLSKEKHSIIGEYYMN